MNLINHLATQEISCGIVCKRDYDSNKEDQKASADFEDEYDYHENYDRVQI